MRTVLTILLIAVIGGICALEAVFIRQGRRMPRGQRWKRVRRSRSLRTYTPSLRRREP